MTIAAAVEGYLKGRGVEFSLLRHPRTHSSKETAQAAHVPDDHVAKAVILGDREVQVMVVIPGDQWVKLRTIQHELGRDLVLVPEQQVDVLFPDCSPGAIPPIGAVYGMETVLDEALTALSFVYFEAGDHEHLVRVSGDDFRKLMGGCRRGKFGHSD